MTTIFTPTNASTVETTTISPAVTTPIDMLSPSQTCERLALSPAGLLALVNDGLLAAYHLGDGIRFRVTHVEAAAQALITN